MENQKIGAFICEARKAKGLTQKQLSEALGVTDKAVSKWERGVSCPDISLLTPLAGVLGVTVTELLAGEAQPPAPEAEAQVKTALTYSASVTGQRWARARWYGFVALTFSCVLAALICFICEFAISQSLTWSLIVFASLVLGWGILAPLLVAGKKRFQKSLLALTILIFPYLGVLSGLVAPGRVVFRLGSAVSAVSLAYLWLGFLLFSRLRGHRWSAVGVLALLAFPHTMAVNAFIPYFLPGETSPTNILVNLFACLLLAALCFGADVMIALGRRKGF